MKAKTLRLACVLMCAFFGLTSFSLCGCHKAIEKEEETTAKEAGNPDEAEDPEETSEEPDETQEDEADNTQTSEEQAMEIADRVGLTEEDLRGEYDLFIEFADAVDNNPSLGEFRGYVFHLFPIIADHLESEDKDTFLEQTRTLEISCDSTQSGIAAYYSPWINSITIGDALGSEGGDGMYALTIYHELMHFIDDSIDGETTQVYYMNDGTFVDSSEADSIDQNNVVSFIEASGFVEGGAEFYITRYYDAGPTTMYYADSATFLSGLEYIYGTEKVDELFFHHDTAYRFVQLLLENGFSGDEAYRLLNALNMQVYGGIYTQVMNPQEALIRLYQNNVDEDYLSDPVFCEILALLADPTFRDVSSDYDYIDHEDSILDGQSDELELTVAEEQYNNETQVGFRLGLYPVTTDGETRFVTLFFLFGGGYDVNEHTFVLDYDFDTDTVNGYEIIDHDWLPKDPVEKLASESSQEAQDLIAELTVDNSAAHSQTAAGSIDELQDQYDRAAEIGSQYGIYIWFADLVPEGVIDESAAVTDPARIDDSLDKIENVLSLYPEDYFDQLLFEYYSGFVLCLYDGDISNPHHNVMYADGEYYMAIYLDISDNAVTGIYGAESLRSDNFSWADHLSVQMIVGIWKCTENYFGNYCDHFENPSVSEDTWDQTNHSYFYYADSIEDLWIDFALESDDESYLLCRESVVSAANDRVLMYEYVMLAALAEATGEPFPEALTPECRNKADELNRAIRAVFNTDSWPAETSWESVGI